MQIAESSTINYSMSNTGTKTKSALLHPVINLTGMESTVNNIEKLIRGDENEINSMHYKLFILRRMLAAVGLSLDHKVETYDGRNNDDAMLVEEDTNSPLAADVEVIDLYDNVSIILLGFYYTIVHIILTGITYCFSFFLYVPDPILPSRILSHWL